MPDIYRLPNKVALLTSSISPVGKKPAEAAQRATSGVKASNVATYLDTTLSVAKIFDTATATAASSSSTLPVQPAHSEFAPLPNQPAPSDDNALPSTLAVVQAAPCRQFRRLQLQLRVYLEHSRRPTFRRKRQHAERTCVSRLRRSTLQSRHNSE